MILFYIKFNFTLVHTRISINIYMYKRCTYNSMLHNDHYSLVNLRSSEQKVVTFMYNYSIEFSKHFKLRPVRFIFSSNFNLRY